MHGPDGLINREVPGKASKLNDHQHQQLAERAKAGLVAVKQFNLEGLHI